MLVFYFLIHHLSGHSLFNEPEVQQTAASPDLRLAADTDADRTGVPKLLIILTDGQSNSVTETVAAAAEAREAGLTLYTVAIGSSVNYQELNSIVGLGNPERAFSIDSYSALVDLLYQVRSETCSIPQRPTLQRAITSCLAENEVMYFGFELPQHGLVVEIKAPEGKAQGYFSYTQENPSEAFHDGIVIDGENFIPYPNNEDSIGIGISRSRRSTGTSSFKALVTQYDSDSEVNQNQTQQVYIAIRGIEKQNNVTLLATEAEPFRNGGSSIPQHHRSFILVLSLFLLSYTFSRGLLWN
jgi:hypothetical protein